MFCNNAEVKNKYIEKIKRLKDEGYIERVPSDDPLIPGKVWFSPHFSTRQDKFRVVYDGSAEFHNRSINAEILPDPDLLVLLFDIITRFRMGKYVIIAVLKECFYMAKEIVWLDFAQS